MINNNSFRTYVRTVAVEAGKGLSSDADGFHVNAVMRIRNDDTELRDEDFCVLVGKEQYPVRFEEENEVSGIREASFSFVIPADLESSVRKLPVSWCYHHGTQEEVCRRIQCQKLEFGDLLLNYDDLGDICYPASVDVKNDRTSFLYQSSSNLLTYTTREVYQTDLPEEQRKLEKAYARAHSWFWRGLNNKIVFWEKHCSRYEESGSVMFEKCIDEGMTNARFILDFNSPDYKRVPKKYRKYLVDRHSMMHYMLFFGAKTMISSEAVTHLMDINPSSGRVRRWLRETPVRYVFLQHGVTYMTRIDRAGFCRGDGFAKHCKFVVSSELEAQELLDYGGYRRENLIISGMPKFDRAFREKDADKIMIMPTWRGYEWNLIRTDLTKSTYYQFIKRILDAIPEEFHDRIVVMPHPLVRDFFRNDETLSRYYDPDRSHDQVLQETEVLITDISSIAFDAFFRGANVIFDWEELSDMCAKGGLVSMMTEDLAFGDLVYDTNEIGKVLPEIYGKPQKEEYRQRYRKIVEFDDRKNTDRCFQAIKDAGYFELNKKEKVTITPEMVENVHNKKYTGFPVIQQDLEVVCGGNVLVKGLDYEITYQDNVGPGNAAVIVTGTGNYTGTVKKKFRIKTD